MIINGVMSLFYLAIKLYRQLYSPPLPPTLHASYNQRLMHKNSKSYQVTFSSSSPKYVLFRKMKIIGRNLMKDDVSLVHENQSWLVSVSQWFWLDTWVRGLVCAQNLSILIRAWWKLDYRVRTCVFICLCVCVFVSGKLNFCAWMGRREIMSEKNEI